MRGHYKSNVDFANVVFKNPDGSIVAVVAKASGKVKQFKIVWHDLMIKPNLGPNQSPRTGEYRNNSCIGRSSAAALSYAQ